MEPAVRERLQALFDMHGVECLTHSWLNTEHSYIAMKTKLHTLEAFAKENGVLREYLSHRQKVHAAGRRKIVSNRGHITWDARKIHEITLEIIDKYSHIPPIEFLKANGYQSYPNAVYKIGKTMDDMRTDYNVTKPSDNRSLDGQVWLSMAETCFANFLLARGVQVTPGHWYGESFQAEHGHRAKYDAHFTATDGKMKGQRMDVEIFGGRRCASQEKYKIVQAHKEEFHTGVATFLAIPYEKCYKEKTLEIALEPYIGRLEVSNVPIHLTKWPSVMWSFYEDILNTAREIQDHMSDRRFPSINWLARTRYHKNRQVESWEPSSWRRFTRQLASIGGVRKIHVALQTSTRWAKRRTKYTKAEVLQALKSFYAEHNNLPGNIQTSLTKIARDAKQQQVWTESGRLAQLVRKHIGNNKVARGLVTS